MVDTARIQLEAFQISPVYTPEDDVKLKKRNRQETKGKLALVKLSTDEMEIDFIGFHASLVNSYRRIILAEVPTMAIEKVYMYNNTSIVQDEVLAHRLGLIPLNADSRLFAFRDKDSKADWGAEDSIKFDLKIRCTKEKNADRLPADLDLRYKNRKVLSSHIEWIPFGNQEKIFTCGGFSPMHDDILLAKLNPGHEIQLEAVAVKGIASDHAKFQPGIAWYRLLPEIELTREVSGSDAVLLQKCFSPGVIDLVTDSKGKTVAQVNDARNDSCSRNVFQYDSIKDSVKLTRKTDHIIFHVESQSCYKSHEILEESISIMINKCDFLLNELNKYVETEEATKYVENDEADVEGEAMEDD